MLFSDWLFANELKTDIFEVHLRELIINNEINKIIDEALNSVGFLEEKLLKEGKSKPKSSFQKMLENRYKILEAEGDQSDDDDDDDDGEVEPPNPFTGDEDAEPVRGSVSADSTEEDKKDDKKKLLKRLKDLMLKIRWVSMKQREDKLKELLEKESEYKKNPSKQLDSEIRDLLKELGYIENKNESEEAIEKAMNDVIGTNNEGKKYIKETGNDESKLANLVDQPLERLQQEFGVVLDKLYRKNQKGLDAKYRLDQGHVSVSHYTDIMSAIAKRKGKDPWVPLVAGLGKSASDLDRDDWTNDLNLRPHQRGTLNQVDSYNKGVMNNAARQSATHSRERFRQKDTITNRSEKEAIVNRDLKNKNFDFYKRYLKDGIAMSYPEDEGSRIGANKIKKYRLEIIQQILELSKENPKDYILNPATDENIAQALRTYLSYEIQSDERRTGVTFASELSGNEDEGGAASDREAAIWASTDRGSWGGSREEDPTQSTERYERNEKIRSILSDLLATLDKKIGITYCLSLGLDCSKGVPENLEISPLYKTVARGGSTKIDKTELTRQLKNLGIMDASDTNVNNWLFRARQFVKSRAESLGLGN